MIVTVPRETGWSAGPPCNPVIVMAAAEGGQVVAVYDFSQQQALTPAEREGGDNPTGRPGRWLQFVRTVMMLLREHGGEAP